MPGTLIPPWYVPDAPSCDDVSVVSVVWGLSLGLSIFAIIRAANQTFHQWKRARRVTAYMVFIWLELIASTIIGGIGWGFVYGDIPPSFELFFFIIVLWMFQIHCVMQIIINRIALLAVAPSTARRLRWGIFTFLLIINISVGIVWIPTRLQISPAWVHVNDIWDRTEKAIFAVVDVCLNLYFVYLVRSSLIEYGLTKYVLLYRFNLAMVVVSVTMDILIIATMSLSNTFLYVIFHPLAYLVKLHIELSMADLIAKIVKASGTDLTCVCDCHHINAGPFAQDLSAHSHNSAPAELGRVASIRGRVQRSLSDWPAPLRIIRGGGDDEEAQRAAAGRNGMGLQILPRTEELGRPAQHTCNFSPSTSRQHHDPTNITITVTVTITAAKHPTARHSLPAQYSSVPLAYWCVGGL
ncbi:hypothetical protein G7Z17_g13627 [Cylindrodendrum hubeiense]|uniref:Integral membrane protein n=1 Tax=Cylindrodendrum hubeiense TaxID=595255 RepID=A0A9P5L826_9HYPO|nr:hypothetical protein G7Z17_g13627 [Cylindrodendrum hubeiense]